MRHLKIAMMIAASLILTMFLGPIGCDDDHRHRMEMHDDRDHSTVIVEHQDNDRHEDHGNR
jgi:hypothetical protein